MRVHRTPEANIFQEKKLQTKFWREKVSPLPIDIKWLIPYLLLIVKLIWHVLSYVITSPQLCHGSDWIISIAMSAIIVTLLAHDIMN